jgi:hypothetical protein
MRHRRWRSVQEQEPSLCGPKNAARKYRVWRLDQFAWPRRASALTQHGRQKAGRSASSVIFNGITI